jgi:RNA-directed DNA polymerase
MNTSLSRTRNRPWGLLEPDAWKAGSSGSEGAGAQQCAPATRGLRIQRHPKRGTAKRYVYTYPSKKALVAVKAKVRALTRGTTNQTLAALCAQLNLVLRGWTTYFRHSVAKATFNYLCSYAWRRVICWLRHKHPRASWKQLRRRYLPAWWPTEGRVRLANPAEVPVTRYRYRGTQIPTPWTTTTQAAS